MYTIIPLELQSALTMNNAPSCSKSGAVAMLHMIHEYNWESFKESSAHTAQFVMLQD